MILWVYGGEGGWGKRWSRHLDVFKAPQKILSELPVENKCQSWWGSLEGSPPGLISLAVAYKIKWGRWPTDEISLGQSVTWLLEVDISILKALRRPAVNPALLEVALGSLGLEMVTYVSLGAWLPRFFSGHCCFSFQTFQEWILPSLAFLWTSNAVSQATTEVGRPAPREGSRGWREVIKVAVCLHKTLDFLSHFLSAANMERCNIGVWIRACCFPSSFLHLWNHVVVMFLTSHCWCQEMTGMAPV